MNNFKKNIYNTVLQNNFVYVTQIEVTVNGMSTPSVVLNYTLKIGGETLETLNYIVEDVEQTKTIQINACVEENSIFVNPEAISVVITYDTNINCN